MEGLISHLYPYNYAMALHISAISQKSPYGPRSKPLHSHHYNSILHNYQSRQDYSEPSASISSKKRSFKKDTYKEDKTAKYTSSHKRGSPGKTANTYQQFKQQLNNRINRIPISPKKPKIESRHALREKQWYDVGNPDLLRSRIETDTSAPDTHNQQRAQVGFDVSVYMEAHKILQLLQKQILVGDTSTLVRRYLEIVATGALDGSLKTDLDLHQAKIVKAAILHQRISVLLVSFSEVTGNLSVHESLLFTLSKCVLDNRVFILGALQTRSQRPEIGKAIIPGQALKNIKQGRDFEVLRDNNDTILEIINKLSAEDNYFYENLRKLIEGSNTLSTQQSFYIVLEYFAFFLHLAGLQDKLSFLSVAPNPYLPFVEKYTLVFDFMEVMYNSKLNSFRPCSQLFIQQMSQFYELVSYSAVFPQQIQELIRLTDKKNRIRHKLYRHHFVKYRSRLEKDLRRIGRPLQKMILLDVQQCRLTPKNTLKVRRWKGSAKDRALSDICGFLASISVNKLNAQEEISRHNERLQRKRKNKHSKNNSRARK